MARLEGEGLAEDCEASAELKWAVRYTALKQDLKW